MSKQFQFCRVCRQNQNQGRGHRYAAKHRRALNILLKKVCGKVEDVRQFLKDLGASSGEIQTYGGKKFWCDFCEQSLGDNQERAFAWSHIVDHLASQKHKENVTSFLAENGGDLEKWNLFVIQGDDLAKWESLGKAVPALVAEDDAQLQDESSPVVDDQVLCNDGKANGSVHSSASFSQKWLAPCSNGGKINKFESSPSLSDNIHHQRFDKPEPAVSKLPVWGKDLTVIKAPSHPGEGNVHSGAPPPWLTHKLGKGEESVACDGGSSSQPLPLSRTQAKKLAKIRNPNRVGAAWAERRRAELEREKRGELVERPSKESSSWLPSFGRVWQSGSRRDTWKEYTVEKLSELKTKQRGGKRQFKEKMSAGTVEFQPYVSKRQRMSLEML